MLKWCNDCRENSVKVKVYARKKDGKKCRVEFCLNARCGYRKELPFNNYIKQEVFENGQHKYLVNT